tara:strand:+ start:2808 stop:3614 length:807 start_codon:yes stop_codon:yes gene_type:complete
MYNTIILTVHNKELSIKKILINLFKTISNKTKRIIIILDGCTDKTSKYIEECILNYKPKVTINILSTPDIWETKANNVGLRLVETQYATIVQDDMLIRQKNWDKTLLQNFCDHKLFAVSGRAAHDFSFEKNHFKVVNLFGREYPFSNNAVFYKILAKIIKFLKPYWLYRYFRFFAVRLAVNRGPLMLDMAKVKQLNFLDESFAPFELDDIDLCCRAYKKFGLFSAANPIFYREINGSKKKNYDSQQASKKSIIKNTNLLMERHLDLSR